MVNFTPSRRAPSPPSPHSFGSRSDNTATSLPLNHPFATYYIPPQGSLSPSVRAGSTSPPSAYAHSHSSLHSKSAYASSERSFSLSSPRSPISSLAQPLTPPHKVKQSGWDSSSSSERSSSSISTSTSSFGSAYHDDDHHHQHKYSGLGHHTSHGYGRYDGHGYGQGQFAPQPLDRTKPEEPYHLSPPSSALHPSYSRYSPPAPASPGYGNLPTELTLFDHRPKHNLLANVEYIIGKKMSFPFLNAFTRPRADSELKLKKQEKESKRTEKMTRPKKLSKERVAEEGWEFWGDVHLGSPGEQELGEIDVLVIEKQEAQPKRKSGRGVREGNWV
ncbi:hypothetical protein IAU59_005725 [Kwoniella sp. CBS 9459]